MRLFRLLVAVAAPAALISLAACSGGSDLAPTAPELTPQMSGGYSIGGNYSGESTGPVVQSTSSGATSSGTTTGEGSTDPTDDGRSGGYSIGGN